MIFPLHRGLFRRILFFFGILMFAAGTARAGSIRGTVTDSTGGRVAGAVVALFQNGKVVTTSVTGSDGSFEITTGASGRFTLVVSAKSFRQLETPVFYAGALDSVERSLVLEPEWVRQYIVVTATGTPTPQPQTSAATSVIPYGDIVNRSDFVSLLRLMPGTVAVQTGQRGAETSLFVRGGNSADTKVLVDGIDAGQFGNTFDFGPLGTSAIERAEVYRGTNSDLYGTDADSGLVSFTTPRGTTSFPSIFLSGDAGNFNTTREEAELAGAYKKLDYLGNYTWFQTSNALPNDAMHLGAAAGNFGYQLSSATQLRGTVHYNVFATGVPNAWDFYHVADQATQKNQDLYISASLDNQTTASFHNAFRYGATRKNETYSLWQMSGCGDYDAYGDSLGCEVTITGANGYSATGQAVLDYAESYPYGDQIVNNRDQVLYQGTYSFTQHLTGLIGFHFEDERSAETIPEYGTDETIGATNYDYLAAVHGDFKERFFYYLGGSLLHYSLFGVYTTPRAGFTIYALKPRAGVFSGTRILLNFGEAVQEPTMSDEFGSLYKVLVSGGFASTAAALGIGPLSPPSTRTYEGGVEQAFLTDHILFKATYFHNEFGRQIEYVGAHLLPSILTTLTPEQQQELIDVLSENGDYQSDYPLGVNTQAFRAQGIEATLEGGIGKSIFLRGGYTYLDAVVQRSFDSDNEALMEGYAPTYNGIPIGALTPLVGARPFRRPPNSGFLTATWSGRKLSVILGAAFASRSDDSTYLEYADENDGNSLLLPNRDLDWGYAKIDLGGSYQLLNWLSVYAQTENLTGNQNIAPIGYPSLPFNFRAGLRLAWGKGSSK